MADNQFSVAVPNVLQALMAGQEGYDQIQKLQQAQSIQKAGQLYAAGDVRGAQAAAAQGGNLQAILGLAGLQNQDRQFGLQQQQFGQTVKSQDRQFGLEQQKFGDQVRHEGVTEGQTGTMNAAQIENMKAIRAEQIRQFDAQQQGQKVPPGFTKDATGNLVPIPGGPADPKYIRDTTSAKEPVKPIPVKPGEMLFDPVTKQVIYKSDSTMSEGAREITARQIINGDLSGLQNLGKGAQGNEVLSSIKNKAADILITENGMTPAEAAAHLGTKLQAFKANQIGLSAEARTTAVRETNLSNILKVTEAAIPAALEASDKVERYAGQFVPLNRIIQKGQVATSDPNLRLFGMANLQLAEHWARAMNPTGVMRESDRDMALSFLSTADTKDTYRQVVNQLHTQVLRERDAIKRGERDASPTAPPPPPAAASGPSGGTTPNGVPWSLK